MTLKEVQDLMACGFSAKEIRGFMAEKPDPEKPDPKKPDPKKPDPEKPDPEKPDPEKPDPVDPYKKMLEDFKATQAAMLKTLETIQQANLANAHQPETEKIDVNKSMLAAIIPPSALK